MTWLAFIVFTKLATTAPKIVEVYPRFEDCVIEAQKRNHAMEQNPPVKDGGFVCLQMAADT